MTSLARILIAVEPPVMAGALEQLLASAGTEVVILDVGSIGEHEHFDVAIVVAALPETISADVVIRLPDSAGNAGIGVIIDLRGTEDVRIDGSETVLDLVELHCSGR